jgi:hypothetical protein
MAFHDGAAFDPKPIFITRLKRAGKPLKPTGIINFTIEISGRDLM